jgi:hypothetical protein
MNGFDAASRVLRDAIAARIFPAAVADVGTSGGVLWQESLGRLTFDDTTNKTTIDTPFDLASLTKVIATATAVMRVVHDGTLGLDEPVSSFFAEWRGADRETVTIRDLLEHASGLPARLVDPPGSGRREFEHDICAIELEYEPRTRSIYSDLGFILLGFIVADRGRLSGYDDMTFGLAPDARHDAAPTIAMNEDLRRGQMLVGEVLTTTHSRWAAWPATPDCSVRRRRSGGSRVRCCGQRAAIPHLRRRSRPNWFGCSPPKARFPAVRERSGGIGCCRHRRAAPA